MLKAKNGKEALEIFRKENKKIDLVILDLNMPGMGGYKCLKELIRIDSKAKVVIASGYSDAGLEKAKSAIDFGAAEFIGKPYQLNDLLKKVREILD